MFLLAFGPDRAQGSIAFLSFKLTDQMNRNMALIYSFTVCEQKTNHCARSGSLQHKAQYRCFQLLCFPAFLTSLLY